MSVDREDTIIQGLINLGNRHGEIRAIILTSTHTNGTADLLSDYDVEVIVSDVVRFAECDDWFEEFGPVLVMRRLKHDDGRQGCIRLVQYQDGTRIDFGITAADDFRRIFCEAPELDDGHDIGYEVLVDKDGIAASLAPPTHRAFIPAVPTREEFADVVNGFWWNSIYVPKSLWRGEVLASASWLDGIRGWPLRVMLDWSVEIEQDWSWRTGMRGKGLGKMLDAETQQELVAACGGGGIEELWQAFFATISLFRKTAVTVAENMGYDYPHDLDAKVTSYHRVISQLDPKLTSKDELARLLKENY